MRFTIRAVLALAVTLGVVACGGTAPDSTAAPGSSLAAMTTSPDRTLDPDQVAAADALRQFVARSAAIDASFHLDQSATMKAGDTDVLDARYALDVAGDDFSGIITAGGQTIHITSAGGRAWYSDDGTTWAEGDPIDAATSADITSPWTYLGPLDELVFLSRDPEHLDNFQFANTGPVPYQTASMRSQGIEGTIDTLNFIVDPTGKPVSLWLHATATPTTGALEGRELDILTTMDFSRMGEPIEIAAPE